VVLDYRAFEFRVFYYMVLDNTVCDYLVFNNMIFDYMVFDYRVSCTCAFTAYRVSEDQHPTECPKIKGVRRLRVSED